MARTKQAAARMPTFTGVAKLNFQDPTVAEEEERNREKDNNREEESSGDKESNESEDESENESEDKSGEESEDKSGEEIEEESEEEREEPFVDEAEEEVEPIQPLEMYFNPSEYTKLCKISTRCFVKEAVDTINRVLLDDEKRWFHEHSQFKHFFHMFKEANHKVTAMWMLILHMARTDKSKECWFVVNGTPIRYSLREHALISGLDCHQLPENYANSCGSMEFVERHFEEGTVVTIKRVEEKLVNMGGCGDRLKMAVLYFLGSVLIGQSKTGKKATEVEPFFQRVVDDLELCKTFPWGRLTFEKNMEDLFHMVDHFGGVGKPTWSFPSFCIPLELLAFEAIPDLKRNFRVDVRGDWSECPRMCKMKFKSYSLKGFPLSVINEALGSTKDIESMLHTSEIEEGLLQKVMDESDDETDTYDPIVDSWRKCLAKNRSVWWEEMFNSDVDARKVEEMAKENEGVPSDPPLSDPLPSQPMAGLADIMESGKALGKELKDGLKNIEDKLTSHEDFVKNAENTEKSIPDMADNWANTDFGCDWTGAQEQQTQPTADVVMKDVQTQQTELETEGGGQTETEAAADRGVDTEAEAEAQGSVDIEPKAEPEAESEVEPEAEPEAVEDHLEAEEVQTETEEAMTEAE